MGSHVSRRRGSGGFFKILLILGLVCGVLIAAGLYVLRSIDEIQPALPRSGCEVRAGEDGDELAIEQAAHAATVAGVAFQRRLPDHAVIVAFATVWQESQFYNLQFGDRDSVGLFQQRPSMEWGEAEELTDPVFASDAFYQELEQVPEYTELPVFEAAQAVQRSADGTYYEQHEERSRVMAEVFTGQAGPALDCWFPLDELADPDIAGAEEELARVFGVGPEAAAAPEDHATGDLGWAMALWAVGNARDYGVAAVTYGTHRWTADTRGANWEQLEDDDALGEGELRLHSAEE
jgi:hypothetical protein